MSRNINASPHDVVVTCDNPAVVNDTGSKGVLAFIDSFPGFIDGHLHESFVVVHIEILSSGLKPDLIVVFLSTLKNGLKQSSGLKPDLIVVFLSTLKNGVKAIIGAKAQFLLIHRCPSLKYGVTAFTCSRPCGSFRTFQAEARSYCCFPSPAEAWGYCIYLFRPMWFLSDIQG